MFCSSHIVGPCLWTGEGFRPGGGAARELVAYQLDRGFAGVPKTAVDKLLLRTRTGTRLSDP